MIAVGLSSGQVNVHDYVDGSVVYTIGGSQTSQRNEDDATGVGSMGCLKWVDIYLGRSASTSYFGARVSFEMA